MEIDGSCHCGNVSYEAEVDPLQVIICHCTDCGSPIYAGPVEGGSSMIGIRVGTCRQRGLLTPQKQYWSHSAQPWAQNLAIAAIVKQE